MKNPAPHHKTPKFGDLCSETLAKALEPQVKKRTISNNLDNSHLQKPEKLVKMVSNKPSSKENRPNIPKPSSRNKDYDKIPMDLPEKPEKGRSRSSFESKDLQILLEKTNYEASKVQEPPGKDGPPERQNIKDKIDFINQIFDSINNKRLKTELPSAMEESNSPEKISEKSLELSPAKNQIQSPCETDEEDLNPRRSRVFPETFVDSKEIQEKPKMDKKKSKEELEERRSTREKKQENWVKNEGIGERKSTIREGNIKKDVMMERKSYKKEDTSFRKEDSYKSVSKPSQSPLKKTIIKNFVQANKKNNGLDRKMYENYEKVLKCFDSDVIYHKELSKSIIGLSKSPLRRIPNKSPIRQKEKEEVPKEVKKPKSFQKPPVDPVKKPLQNNRGTLSRDSRRITNQAGLKGTDTPEPMDMKSLYKEISNLTKTLNKAAELMSETFKKIETVSKTPIKMRESTEESLSEDG